MSPEYDRKLPTPSANASDLLLLSAVEQPVTYIKKLSGKKCCVLATIRLFRSEKQALILRTVVKSSFS